ncbi:hypothetical protein MJH12_13485, partial [bacterium]|nr:hypothetical protein [bacterium]
MGITKGSNQKNRVIKVSFFAYLDSKLLTKRYGLVNYVDPSDTRDFSGVMIDLNQYEKDQWIEIVFFVPDFSIYDQSKIHFSLKTHFDFGMYPKVVWNLSAINKISGLFIHKITLNNDLPFDSLDLPSSKILDFVALHYAKILVVILFLFTIFSRYYLYSLICLCLLVLSLIGILFFPMIGSVLNLDYKSKAVLEIELDCKKHLYRLARLKKEYELGLSNHLNEFNQKANTIVNAWIDKKNDDSKKLNKRLRSLINQVDKKSSIEYWICNSDRLYTKTSRNGQKTDKDFQGFIRLVFPIIMGKATERKSSDPIEVDRYRTKVRVLKEFIESAFDNADFLQNFLSNPNRLFRMSTGSGTNTKAMDQSMWSYFLDDNNRFWLVFAKVKSEVMLTKYAMEVDKYRNSIKGLDLTMYYSRRLFSFPKRILTANIFYSLYLSHLIIFEGIIELYIFFYRFKFIM